MDVTINDFWEELGGGAYHKNNLFFGKYVFISHILLFYKHLNESTHWTKFQRLVLFILYKKEMLKPPKSSKSLC